MDAPEPWKDWMEIVSAVRMGNEAASAAFARIVGSMARSYFRRQGLSPTKAEDMAVSCVTDVTLKLNQFDGRSLTAWIHTIFRHTLAGVHRNQPKLVEADTDEWEGFTWNGEPSRLNRRMRGAIAKALAQLDPQDQRLIALRHGREPLEFKVIGVELGISAVNARVRLKRALTRLDKLLRADPRMEERIARCENPPL